MQAPVESSGVWRSLGLDRSLFGRDVLRMYPGRGAMTAVGREEYRSLAFVSQVFGRYRLVSIFGVCRRRMFKGRRTGRRSRMAVVRSKDLSSWEDLKAGTICTAEM